MSRKMIIVIAVLSIIALATGGALALTNDTETPGPALIGSASASPASEPSETPVVSASPTAGASHISAAPSASASPISPAPSASASPSVDGSGDNSGPGGDDDGGFDDDDSGRGGDESDRGDDPGSDDD